MRQIEKYEIIILFILSILIFSCTGNSEKEFVSVKNEELKPMVRFDEIGTDFMKWWTYHSYNISLSSTFVGLDEKSETIDKKQFLEKLTSGNFIPLQMKSADKKPCYKLYKLDSLADKSIGRTMINESSVILGYFKKEGTKFPEFEFVDIKGNTFTSENTKGKTIVFKTWFIHCAACILEFPELNELVERYKDRSDVVFLSLALDSKIKLDRFLADNFFEYQVVANQKTFIADTLLLQSYPTHIIVDGNGTIQKVVNKASEMISFLSMANI